MQTPAAAATARFRDDAFRVYAAGMTLSFLLPAAFVALGKEWAAVRNWQTLATVLALALVVHRRGRLAQFWTGEVPAAAWWRLLWASALSYAVSTLSRYKSFEVNGYDFSIFDIGLYNTWHGKLMANPICDCAHFSIHLNWIILPLAPLVVWISSPIFLLMLHAAIAWSAAFPLRLMARRYLGSERLAFLVVLAYLASSRTGSIVGYPFHPEVLFLPLGFWLIEAWDRQRTWLWMAAALLFWATKEEAGLYTFGFALGQALLGARERQNEALLFSVASLAAFLVSVLWIHPLFRDGASMAPSYASVWSQYGTTTAEVVKGMILAPHRVISDLLTSHWYVLFGSALFLPLLSPRGLIAMLPALVILATASAASMRHFGLYYSAPLLPFLFWAMLDSQQTATRFGGAWPSRLRTSLALATILMPLIGAGYVRFYPAKVEAAARFVTMTAPLKPGDVLCVQAALIPHMPYDADVRLISRECLARPGAVGIWDPELNPFPMTKPELLALATDTGLTP